MMPNQISQLDHYLKKCTIRWFFHPHPVSTIQSFLTCFTPPPNFGGLKLSRLFWASMPIALKCSLTAVQFCYPAEFPWPRIKIERFSTVLLHKYFLFTYLV
jgi:hypothetical protein